MSQNQVVCPVYTIKICPECLRQAQFYSGHECNDCLNISGKKIAYKEVAVETVIPLEVKAETKQAIEYFDNMQTVWRYEFVELPEEYRQSDNLFQALTVIYLFHPTKSDIGHQLINQYFAQDISEALQKFKDNITSQNIDIIEEVEEECLSMLKSTVLNQIRYNHCQSKEVSVEDFRDNLQERFKSVIEEFTWTNNTYM